MHISAMISHVDEILKLRLVKRNVAASFNLSHVLTILPRPKAASEVIL